MRLTRQALDERAVVLSHLVLLLEFNPNSLLKKVLHECMLSRMVS